MSVQLMTLLRRLRTRGATDARDKVFSVYGLKGAPVCDPLHINYTMTKREVFTATTRHIIKNTHSLSILHSNMMRLVPNEVGSVLRSPATSFQISSRDGPAIFDIPSWVVDWSLSPDKSAV